MKKLWNILILLSVFLAGCNKTDDLWDEVHDLQKRLTKLEIQVNNLNGNITALQELYKNGASIQNVEEKDGFYTLTLSNGKVLKVVQKMEKTIFPIVGINEAGNWTVRYGDETPIDLGIKATGENGKTPQFRINEDGYWEMRYADTEEWTNKLGPDGAPVKAEGESAQGSEQFFESVGKSADGKTFDIEMKDGTKLSVPIVSSFSCTFEESVTGIQKFNSEETKTFKVLLNGVDNIALLAVPTGWVAELSDPAGNEATLTVTAPKAIATTTRATASTSKDISILANANKFSTILKLQVEVIPADPSINYEELYNANKDLFVIGEGASAITINKTTFTASEDIDLTVADQTKAKTILTPAQPTIYFLTGSNTLKITMDGEPAMNAKKVVFISKTSAEKPNIEFVGTAGIRFQQNSSLVFKNVGIQNLIMGNYSSTSNAATLWIEDCVIKKIAQSILALTGTNAPLGGIDCLYFKNNYIEMNDFPDKSFIFNVGNKVTTDIAKVVIDNNIWYRKATLGQGSIYNSTALGVTRNISLSNNTIINYAGNSSNSVTAAYLVLSNAEEVTIKNNIGYSDDTTTDGLSNSGSSFYIISNVTTVPSITIEGNIVYGLNPELTNTWKWNTYGWKTNAATKVEQDGESKGIITRYSKNPFANPSGFDSGNFSPIPELTGKGSNLK